jgi:hypothetical protein
VTRPNSQPALYDAGVLPPAGRRLRLHVSRQQRHAKEVGDHGVPTEGRRDALMVGVDRAHAHQRPLGGEPVRKAALDDLVAEHELARRLGR